MTLCAMFKMEFHPAGEGELLGNAMIGCAFIVIMCSMLRIDLNGKLKTVIPTIKYSHHQDWIGTEPKSIWY